jgi:hypothetical protein
MSNQSTAIYFEKGQSDKAAGIKAKYESAYSWQAKAYLQGYNSAKAVVEKPKTKIVKVKQDKRPTAHKVTPSRNKREGKFAGKWSGIASRMGSYSFGNSGQAYAASLGKRAPQSYFANVRAIDRSVQALRVASTTY